MKEIYKKLADIQQKLKSPKGLYNEFGKFSYRSAEDILEAVKPLLKEHGLALVLEDEIVEKGERFYVKATAKLYPTTGLQGEDDGVEATAYAREQDEKKGMDSAQVTGSCSSYARKYAICGLFCISSGGKDPDEMDNTSEGNSKAKIDQSQIITLDTLCKDANIDVEAMLKAYNVEKIEELNLKQYGNILEFWDEVKKTFRKFRKAGE